MREGLVRQGARRLASALGVGALVALACACDRAQAGDAGPRRIVSLNLCTDVLVAELVPRGRVAAVSVLGPDPQVSAAAATLAGWPTVRGDAEEVLALDPDLVLTVAGARAQTVSLLRRLGRRVVTIPMATDFGGIRSALSQVADAVGARERGRTLIARLDATLARAAAAVARADRDTRRPTAVAVQVGNLVSGAGSLVDHALQAAGFENVAAQRTLGGGGRLPLEALVARPPDLVVLANDPAEFRTAAADNLRHPAFATLLTRVAHVSLPLPTWICGGPAVADAVVLLAHARQRVAAERRP